ncbi:MAG: diguanylate cyclase [Leptothrix sp. (in: b-proteobacteria)]
MGQWHETAVQDQFVVLDANETLAPYRLNGLYKQPHSLSGMAGSPVATVQARPLPSALVPQWRRCRPGSAARQPHDTMALLMERTRALEFELRRKTHDYEQTLAEQNARLEALAAAQKRLESLAGRDELTGLPNRHTFIDRLTQAIHRAVRAGSSLAVLFLDLDDFRLLNDCYGQEAGDQALKQVAERLQHCIRGSDTVGRWGSDEFALVTENAGDAEANLLAERIMAALSEPLIIGETSINVSACVGLCLFPDDGLDGDTLVHNANTAMRQAKWSGKTYGPKATVNVMPTAATAHPHSQTTFGDESAPTLLTVEDAASKLGVSRPHVFKLIDEQRLRHIVWQDSNMPLIPLDEISRFTQETVT